MNAAGRPQITSPAEIGPLILKKLRWTLRRWSLKNIWYRVRLPYRRRRWRLENLRTSAGFVKDSAARLTNGPAIAFGEFSGSHGLSRAAAYDLASVRQRHSSVEIVDIGPYLRSGSLPALNFATPVENAYFLCQPDNYEAIFRLLPPEYLARAYRVGRWVWETPLFPEDWRFAERLVHEVWTTSEFCGQTFRTALGIPVSIVPYAVTVPVQPKIDMRARLQVSPDAFLGLAVMDIVSCPERKNPWDHVRAWQAAFGADPAKILIIKLRVGKRTRIVVDELKDLIGAADNVVIVTDELGHDEIAALHRAADIYISLHRSEGFGLNIYEALLLGTPTIATDWSANSEYGPNFPTYFPVKYELKPYRDWLGHYSDTKFRWASASVEDASRQLKECASAWARYGTRSMATRRARVRVDS